MAFEEENHPWTVFDRYSLFKLSSLLILQITFSEFCLPCYLLSIMADLAQIDQLADTELSRLQLQVCVF